MIAYGKQDIRFDDIEFVVDVLKSDFLTQGPIALKFALNQDWIDKIVVGVDSVSQLKALVEIEKSSVSPDFPLLRCDNPNLINPSKWNLV